MPEYQVTCVTKPHRYSTHEHITHIGNVAQKWSLTREQAIVQIDARTAAFFTVDYPSGKRVYVRVVREWGKQPYLRTEADGRPNDNLLALAECGMECRLVA